MTESGASQSGYDETAPTECIRCGMNLACKVTKNGKLRVGCACSVRMLDVEMPDTWNTETAQEDQG